MHASTIAFIGGGNMATAMIGGLVAGGHPATEIRVAEPSSAVRKRLTTDHGVVAVDDAASAIAGAEAVVLAVKPQVLSEVCQALGPQLPAQPPLVISIAAGVRCADIARWLGRPAPLVRVMPNTPSLVGAGASALWAGAQTSAEQRAMAETIMRSAGTSVWVPDEGDLDAVTALSGSGPAYYFLIIEAMTDAGEQLGLARDTAMALARQTALGAARMAIESGEDVTTLRQRVSSPGGTTERGIASLEQGGLRALVAQTLQAARQRAVELADEMGRS